jgi:hypothetical protein
VTETGSNIEVARHLSENHHRPQSTKQEVLEFAEAIVLAIVAVATAWSGYQAALWTGRQSERYGVAARYRVQAQAASEIANQERLFNAATVDEWAKASIRGEKKLAVFFERRILPDFRPAFEAWKETHPLTNPNAPPGPFVMPSYHSDMSDNAKKLNEQATETFEMGNRARERSDDYVRITVMLATVLLLTAISQRFKIHAVRLSLLCLATLLLVFPIYRILTLPRA